MSLMQRCFRVGSLLLCAAVLPCMAHAQGSPSTVVAKQGSATVTLDDMDTFAQSIPEDKRAGFFDSPTRLQTVISNLLVTKQLAAEARALGLEKDPKVKAQIDAAAEIALSKVRMERFRADLKVPDMAELAREDYLGHKETYVIPGKFDVKQIFVSARTHSEDEAKALAETVQKEAKADPDKFDALIEKYSEDPDKATTHGLVTQAGSTQYMPALAKAAKLLTKSGEISPVVKTTTGYRVIKLIERTPDHQQKFAEVSAQIAARLRDEYITKQVKNHTDVLHNEPIDANPDLVASLRTRYGVAPTLPVPAAQ